MKVVAAGTGPAQGFPVAGCECAACRAARRDGVRLTPAELRIEAADGRQFVLTAAGIPREFAGGSGLGAAGTEAQGFPLTEVDGLSFIEVDAVGTSAVLIGVGREAGVLWAPGSGEIRASAIAAHGTGSGRYAAWSVALTAGSVGLALLGPGPDGDLSGCARTLAALRASGVLTDDARTVLIGATHDSVRGARRELLLAAWGLPEAVPGQQWAEPDGRSGHSDLAGRSDVPERPGRVLVIGGAASGKSQLAEDLLAASPQVSYLATGPAAEPAADPDWAWRVQRHQARRPGHWRTVETSDPASALQDVGHPVLLDSLGSWLTGVLDRTGAWQQAAGWQERVAAETRALVTAWSARPGAAVAVSDEVGWGVIPATPSGRLFQDLLGQLNQAVAGASDQVVVVVAGQLLSPLSGRTGSLTGGLPGGAASGPGHDRP